MDPAGAASIDLFSSDTANYRDNLADVRSRAPADATARSALLLDWAGQGTDAEVPDPYTGGSREFDQVWAMVEAAARAIVARFADRGRIDA